MAETRPNILLVTTDQQRFDTCGPKSPPWMRTPHFDHLTREGICYQRAYADCPVCVPARVGIMTGKYAHNHGMIKNGATQDVMGREGTLPTLLREAGYQTCAIGKMHFEPERNRHGFDEMILPADYYRQMERSGQPLQPMRHGLGQNEVFPTMGTVPEAQSLTSWTAEQSVDYIMDRRDPTTPFFLWCSFSKPHPPFDPPEPYYSMYKDLDLPHPTQAYWSSGEDCPTAFLRRTQHQSYDLVPREVVMAARAAYYGLVTQVDYNMGRVFAALMDKQLWDNTLIIYTSDHGEMLGDHHTFAKTFFYEGASHIPFAMRLPRTWKDRPHGVVSDQVVTHADILPTLLNAAGASVPKGLDGQNLVATQSGQEKPREYLEGTCNGMYYALTDGKWKYIYYPEGKWEQLFNLEDDPLETNNLVDAQDAQKQLKVMKSELLSRHRKRKSAAVDGSGQFVSYPVYQDKEADRRDITGPGYVTERFPHDVKH